MKNKNVIELVKFGGSLVIGLAIGAITRPAVEKFFGIDKKDVPETIPSEDIEEEEVTEE